MTNVARASSPSQDHSVFSPHQRERVGAHAATQRAIVASAPWQYALPDDGRKGDVLRIRRHWLAVYLSGWRSIYMSLNRMVADLQKHEGKRNGAYLTWSRATVKRTLADLVRLGVVMPCGRIGFRKPRLRVLRADALPSRPMVANATEVQPGFKSGSTHRKKSESRPNTSESELPSFESEPVTLVECEPQENPSTVKNPSDEENLEKNQHRQIDGSPAKTSGDSIMDVFFERFKSAVMSSSHVSTDEEYQAASERRRQVERERQEHIETHDRSTVTNADLLDLLTEKYGHRLASSIYGWICNRVRCARDKNPKLEITFPRAFVLKAASNFFDDRSEYTQSRILDKYDFAEENGYVFNPATNSWCFSLSKLAEHDLESL